MRLSQILNDKFRPYEAEVEQFQHLVALLLFYTLLKGDDWRRQLASGKDAF